MKQSQNLLFNIMFNIKRNIYIQLPGGTLIYNFTKTGKKGESLGKNCWWGLKVSDADLVWGVLQQQPM